MADVTQDCYLAIAIRHIKVSIQAMWFIVSPLATKKSSCWESRLRAAAEFFCVCQVGMIERSPAIIAGINHRPRGEVNNISARGKFSGVPLHCLQSINQGGVACWVTSKVSFWSRRKAINMRFGTSTIGLKTPQIVKGCQINRTNKSCSFYLKAREIVWLNL